MATEVTEKEVVRPPAVKKGELPSTMAFPPQTRGEEQTIAAKALMRAYENRDELEKYAKSRTNQEIIRLMRLGQLSSTDHLNNAVEADGTPTAERRIWDGIIEANKGADGTIDPLDPEIQKRMTDRVDVLMAAAKDKRGIGLDSEISDGDLVEGMTSVKADRETMDYIDEVISLGEATGESALEIFTRHTRLRDHARLKKVILGLTLIIAAEQTIRRKREKREDDERQRAAEDARLRQEGSGEQGERSADAQKAGGVDDKVVGQETAEEINDSEISNILGIASIDDAERLRGLVENSPQYQQWVSAKRSATGGGDIVLDRAVFLAIAEQEAAQGGIEIDPQWRHKQDFDAA